MSKASHYRAWCNACHGNTLHRLQPFGERLWACIKCDLNGRASTVVINQENHMSLEDAVKANTEAVKALTAALQAGGGTPAAKGGTKEADKTLDYTKDVKPPFLALVKSHGRDFALGKLKEAFGYESLKSAETASEVPKYADIIAKIAAWSKEDKPKKADDIA